MSTATGIGSWPGTDMRRTVRTVRDLLSDEDLPYLPELPARGPGADLVGRTAGLLVDIPVDLQPVGWRLVGRPGLDAGRTARLWVQDLDELAEAYDGYRGGLKVQVAGPWTLVSSVWLHRGERAVVDAGATRDLVASLAEGVRRHLEQVQRLVPGATLVLQVDEPALPAVLAGRLPTASGYGVLRAVEPERALTGLTDVLGAASTGPTARETVVHCCAPDLPWTLLRDCRPSALAVDTSLLGPRGWESVAATVESGVRLWAGVAAPLGDPGPVPDGVRALGSHWRDVGLAGTGLADVTVTPACGLAGSSPDQAAATQGWCVAAARALTEHSAD